MNVVEMSPNNITTKPNPNWQWLTVCDKSLAAYISIQHIIFSFIKQKHPVLSD